LKLIFRKAHHCLESVLDKDECPSSSFKLLGEHLITRNINIVGKLSTIDKIMIPEEFRKTLDLVRRNFPSIEVENFRDGLDPVMEHNANGLPNTSSLINGISHNTVIATQEGKIKLKGNEDSIQIPLNAVLHYPAFQSADTIRLHADFVVYPWDFLNIVHKTLHEEVKDSIISPNATIAKSSIISGPCIIEEGVKIDDFCKIIGPTYIGKGSFIGMSSLIRNCMFDNNTRIGFNCEIGKSYFAGDDKIAHQNVILDSIIGRNVWFGGYSGTANVLLNRKNIKFSLGNGELVDTGTDHFGTVVGNNCAVGAAVIILPGRQLSHNTVIQAGTVVGKPLTEQEIYFGKKNTMHQIPASTGI
jgi:acetyltransferase-like isoleucine patch superfamily enzyme